MTATAEQPAPVPSDRPAIQDLVIDDIRTRKQVGIQRYGTPLQAHNGRDALRDAYEEALDLAQYLRQAIEERDAIGQRIDGARTEWYWRRNGFSPAGQPYDNRADAELAVATVRGHDPAGRVVLISRTVTDWAEVPDAPTEESPPVVDLEPADARIPPCVQVRKIGRWSYRVTLSRGLAQLDERVIYGARRAAKVADRMVARPKPAEPPVIYLATQNSGIGDRRPPLDCGHVSGNSYGCMRVGPDYRRCGHTRCEACRDVPHPCAAARIDTSAQDGVQ